MQEYDLLAIEEEDSLVVFDLQGNQAGGHSNSEETPDKVPPTQTTAELVVEEH